MECLEQAFTACCRRGHGRSRVLLPVQGSSHHQAELVGASCHLPFLPPPHWPPWPGQDIGRWGTGGRAHGSGRGVMDRSWRACTSHSALFCSALGPDSLLSLCHDRYNMLPDFPRYQHDSLLHPLVPKSTPLLKTVRPFSQISPSPHPAFPVSTERTTSGFSVTSLSSICVHLCPIRKQESSRQGAWAF